MTPERWAQVQALMESALSVPPQSREEWLRSQSTLDPEIANQLRSLLENVEDNFHAIDRGWAPTEPALPPAPKIHLFETGEEISGRFRVEAFLGSGGMGEVYGCHDSLSGQKVAVKTLRAGAEDPALERRLRDELVARRISHPNVCRLFDVFRCTGRKGRESLCITMQWVQGHTLAEEIARGPLAMDRALQFALQLCSGLHAAHQASVVHRDFKSSNILVDSIPPESVVITDFGLARDVSNDARSVFETGLIAGTPAYMAPEQFSGGKIGKASDIYALGAVLYEMVVGQAPFEGQTAMAVGLRKMKETAPRARKSRTDLPPHWDAVIAACLEKDPAYRPRDCALVEAQLRGEAAPPRPRWHRRAWMGAVAGAFLAGSGAYVYRTLYQPEEKLSEDALSALRKGQEFAKSRTEESIHNAILELTRATQLAPNSKDAWNSLGEAYATAANFLFLNPREALAKAEHAVGRSLQLNSKQPRALGILGNITSNQISRWKQAEPYFQRSFALTQDDPLVYGWYATWLGRIGRQEEALELIRKALALDPPSQPLNHNLAVQYLRMRRYADYLAQAREMVRLKPADPSTHLALARAYERLGRYEDALKSCAEAEKYSYSVLSQCMRAAIEAGRGNAAKAWEIVAEVEERWRKGNVETLQLLYVYAQLKDVRKVVELGEEGVRRGDPTVIAIGTSPYFDAFKDDPAYKRLLAKIGF